MERSNTYQEVNLYVKNLDDNIDDERLRKEFTQFGTITSAKVMTNEDGRSKGFGFVCFSSSEEAAKALSEMNEKIIVSKPLYVALAQRKEDRKAHLASQYMCMQEHRKGQGVNVYVKNLDDNIDDERLRKEFAQFGTITSAKVMTKNNRSKGFGFVCFSSPEEASKAIAEMDGRIILTKPLYVALAQRKEDRKAHLASLYMQDIIRMDKQVVTEGDLSKRFEFFSSPKETSKAIDVMNGRIVDDEPLNVALAKKKNDLEAQLASQYMQDIISMDKQGEQTEQGIKVFVMNLDDNIDDERLRKEFAQFGTITSAKVMTEDGKSKGFGFVCFSSPEEATKAIVDMNGRIIVTRPLYVTLVQGKEDREAQLASQYMQDIKSMDRQAVEALNGNDNAGKTLDVGRAQKMIERQAELKEKFERIRMERINRYQGVNLYVKNLDDNIDDERLKKEFAQFGTITSAKVMTENGRSKKFGFVCFSSPEEASKAIEVMNGRIIVTKSLYVAHAQKKEDRKAHLASLYNDMQYHADY